MASKSERKAKFAENMKNGIFVKAKLKNIYSSVSFSEYATLDKSVAKNYNGETIYTIENYTNDPNMKYYNIDETKLPAPAAEFEDGPFYHCDDMSDSEGCLPHCVKAWVDHNRLPATEKWEEEENGIDPVLFATDKYTGSRVKVNMASRFGDVGVCFNLEAENGYSKRVSLLDLKDFSETI